MSETVQSWIERTASNPGVLACGVRLADRSVVAKSYRDDLPEARVAQAVRELAEAVFVLQQNRLGVDQIHWRFENGQIVCSTRPGGVLVAVLVGQAAADSAAVEKLIADFAPAAS